MQAAALSHCAPRPTDETAYAQIKRDGYVVLRQVADPATVAALHGDLAERFERTPFCTGDFYGFRTKRFGAVLKRSPAAADLVMNRRVLDLVHACLAPFCDRFQVSLTQALQIHPGEYAQAPHRDQDMYGGQKGEIEYLLNVMWPFERYTQANGSTRIYVGSNHRLDVSAAELPAPIAVDLDPGDALIFLGSTLHGAGANHTDRPRTGMIVGYSLGWLKPYENQWLAYPPEIARTFAPELAALIGYSQHRPGLGNYEGQCPSVLLREETSDFLSATDDLTDQQRVALAAFKQRQMNAQAA
jgi:ectoine hydroxylase-related dioxygenase (phytanoyl-CoA dioxygenase family)